MNKGSYIRRFNEIGIDDIPLVGGKNASLGGDVPKPDGYGCPRPQRLCRYRRGLSFMYLSTITPGRHCMWHLTASTPIRSRICRRGAKKRGRCHEPQSGLGTRHHPHVLEVEKCLSIKPKS